MISAAGQLRALLRLRWQMLRSAGARAALIVSAVLVCWLLYAAVGVRSAVDAPTLATALELAPAAFLGFGALAVIAPLTSGGGSEVIPADQLVAYPVRSSTRFLGGLLLAPLNLVWIVQLLMLAALTGLLTLGSSLPRGLITTASYVLCLTVLGQALAWFVAGLQESRRGRWTVGATAALGLVAVVVVVRSGWAGDLLSVGPTRHVVRAVSTDEVSAWIGTTSVMLLVTAVGALAGVRACSWAVSRPAGRSSTDHTNIVRRRSARRGPFWELVAVDRASVWRAPALRRGGVILAVLPGLAAAGAALPYESLVILPGLVAAGAGLLFGINVFALDGVGALWLTSLPHAARTAALAKTVVLTETVLAAAVVAALLGSLRTPGSPSVTQLLAIACAALACTAVVVAQCMRSAVRRPHRADLRGPRDAVAPPGAMAHASVRLAVPTTLIGTFIAAAATTGVWWLPLLFATVPLGYALLSLRRTLASYDNPTVRSRVAHAVSAG